MSRFDMLAFRYIMGVIRVETKCLVLSIKLYINGLRLVILGIPPNNCYHSSSTT